MTCSKCAREVPVGESWCSCGGPAEFSARDRERMGVDIRARILWADPIKAIQEDWLKKGASGEEVRRAIDDGVRERDRHFRMRGLQDLMLGFAFFGLTAGCLWVRHAVNQGEMQFSGRGYAYVLIASVVLPLVGLALTIRGVGRLLTGGKAEKAATDLSD